MVCSAKDDVVGWEEDEGDDGLRALQAVLEGTHGAASGAASPRTSSSSRQCLGESCDGTGEKQQMTQSQIDAPYGVAGHDFFMRGGIVAPKVLKAHDVAQSSRRRNGSATTLPQDNERTRRSTSEVKREEKVRTVAWTQARALAAAKQLWNERASARAHGKGGRLLRLPIDEATDDRWSQPQGFCRSEWAPYSDALQALVTRHRRETGGSHSGLPSVDGKRIGTRTRGRRGAAEAHQGRVDDGGDDERGSGGCDSPNVYERTDGRTVARAHARALPARPSTSPPPGQRPRTAVTSATHTSMPRRTTPASEERAWSLHFSPAVEAPTAQRTGTSVSRCVAAGDGVLSRKGGRGGVRDGGCSNGASVESSGGASSPPQQSKASITLGSAPIGAGVMTLPGFGATHTHRAAADAERWSAAELSKGRGISWHPTADTRTCAQVRTYAQVRNDRAGSMAGGGNTRAHPGIAGRHARGRADARTGADGQLGILVAGAKMDLATLPLSLPRSRTPSRVLPPSPRRSPSPRRPIGVHVPCEVLIEQPL